MLTAEAYYNHLMLQTSQGVIVISLVPLLWGLFKWKQLNKALIIFWFFLLASVCLFLLEQLFVWSVEHYPDFWWPILDQLEISDTNFLRYPYQLNNFILLGWFLYHVLIPAPIARYVKYLSLGLAVLVSIHYFFNQGYLVAGGFNSTVSAAYCFALPLVSMWYLYNQYNKVPLVHNPYFWINLGLIIPNILGFFLYFAGDIMFRERFDLFAQITITKNSVEMIAQLLTTIGFFYARNTKYLS